VVAIQVVGLGILLKPDALQPQSLALRWSVHPPDRRAVDRLVKLASGRKFCVCMQPTYHTRPDWKTLER